MFTNLSIHWLPLLPAWLVVLLAVALLTTLAYGSLMLLRKQVPGRWVAVLGGCRLAVVAVFVVAMLQPVVSYTRPVEPLPELMILVDTSESMARPGDGQTSRLAEVLPRLQNGDLASALRNRYRLHWFAFDGNAYPLDNPADLRPVGNSTRVSESLTTATNLLRASGVRPDRVLLVSDGNDLGQTDPVETAQRLGLVVDTLAPGGTAAAPSAAEIAVADVQSARRVLLGSDTHFRVTLRANHDRGTTRPVPLVVAEDGKEVWKQNISFKAGTNEQRVAVAHRPAKTGIKKYEFRLGNEAKPYQMSVQVVDGKNEVLILEDTWRWEFKFLRRLFEDDPSFRFTALLSRGRTSFVQFGSPDRRVNLVSFPQGRAELEGFDTILLGDVNVKRWPRDLAPAIARMVREEGKSLVLLAGPNLASLVESRELNALLPVELTRESATPVSGPVEVRVSDDGASSPFFTEAPAGGTALAGRRLPALDQVYPPLRKRPGATVLLEAARHANSYGNVIVMAEQTVGRGRVLYVGTDTLWKWQTLGPANQTQATAYSVFWQQALRHLTPARPGSNGVQVWLQPDRSRYEVGRSVGLRAEVRSDRPLNQPKVQGAVVLPDDRRLPLAFAVDPADPNVLRAEFETSLSGPHQIIASLTTDGRTAAETATLIDVEPAPGEQSDAGIDRANLSRISTATGGKVIDPARPETWPAATEGPRPTVQQARTLDLWNNYTLMLLLCGLLGADWLLRLLRGYV